VSCPEAWSPEDREETIRQTSFSDEESRLIQARVEAIPSGALLQIFQALLAHLKVGSNFRHILMHAELLLFLSSKQSPEV
jgi:hypothetical protein